jgi:F-type H+-transporting ATPase subunit delta
MNPDNSLTINAVEAYPLDAFSADVRFSLHILITFSQRSNERRVTNEQAVRSGLAEAQKVAAGSGSEAEKAEARVEVEVFEALQSSMTKV